MMITPRRDVLISLVSSALLTTISPRIYFYGPVTRSSCSSLMYDLLEFDSFRTDSSPPIHVHVKSEGGDYRPMINTIGLIRSEIKTPIWTFVDGVSIGPSSLLVVSGKKRFMTPTSTLGFGGMRGYGPDECIRKGFVDQVVIR